MFGQWLNYSSWRAGPSLPHLISSLFTYFLCFSSPTARCQLLKGQRSRRVLVGEAPCSGNWFFLYFEPQKRLPLAKILGWLNCRISLTRCRIPSHRRRRIPEWRSRIRDPDGSVSTYLNSGFGCASVDLIVDVRRDSADDTEFCLFSTSKPADVEIRQKSRVYACA